MAQNVKLELLKDAVIDVITENIDFLGIDPDDIVDTKATKMLGEIQQVLVNKENDFEIVEDIVCIFEKYNVSAGTCHDFG